MKKLFLILCAAMMLNVMPLAAVPADSTNDPIEYPVYTGNLNDPDILVVYSGKGYVIVKYKGKIMVWYR